MDPSGRSETNKVNTQKPPSLHRGGTPRCAVQTIKLMFTLESALQLFKVNFQKPPVLVLAPKHKGHEQSHERSRDLQIAISGVT